MFMKISRVTARQIYDSRGYPTVEADVYLDNGNWGRAAVPSGASRGDHEALELRDGGRWYNGLGVDKAVGHIKQQISKAIVGLNAADQANIDKTLIALDNTKDKSSLGANAMLAVSLATAKAAANQLNQPLFRYIESISHNHTASLPMPMCNILNGGRHAQGSTDIQEFMIVPVGAQTIQEALRLCSEVFHALGKVLDKRGYALSVGDEGGYAPALKGGTKEALDLIIKAVAEAGFQAGKDVAIALDVAASELIHKDRYVFSREKLEFNSDKLIDWYQELVHDYPIISIEDGLGQDDWSGWQKLQTALGKDIQIVGDDLLVTNTHRIKQAIEKQACNAALIKPNQIGTLSETIEAVNMAQQAGWRTIISHRSGETEDTTIAHLAVGLNTGQIKTGSFSRSERLAKYNELIRIAELAPHLLLAS